MVFLDEHIQKSHQSQLRSICVPLDLSLEEVEKVVITQILEKCNYDRPSTARELGIGSRTLLRKLKKLGISRTGEDEPAVEKPELTPELGHELGHERTVVPEITVSSTGASQTPSLTAEPAVRKQRPSLPSKAKPALPPSALGPEKLATMAATTELAS